MLMGANVPLIAMDNPSLNRHDQLLAEPIVTWKNLFERLEALQTDENLSEDLRQQYLKSILNLNLCDYKKLRGGNIRYWFERIDSIQGKESTPHIRLVQMVLGGIHLAHLDLTNNPLIYIETMFQHSMELDFPVNQIYTFNQALDLWELAKAIQLHQGNATFRSALLRNHYRFGADSCQNKGDFIDATDKEYILQVRNAVGIYKWKSMEWLKLQLHHPDYYIAKLRLEVKGLIAAAEMGHVRAQYDLATLYRKIDDSINPIADWQVQFKDEEKHLYWLQAAAGNGHPEAILQLGMYFLNQDDHFEALRHFTAHLYHNKCINQSMDSGAKYINFILSQGSFFHWKQLYSLLPMVYKEKVCALLYCQKADTQKIAKGEFNLLLFLPRDIFYDVVIRKSVEDFFQDYIESLLDFADKNPRKGDIYIQREVERGNPYWTKW